MCIRDEKEVKEKYFNSNILKKDSISTKMKIPNFYKMFLYYLSYFFLYFNKNHQFIENIFSKYFHGMNSASHDTHILFYGLYEYVMLPYKRKFSDTIMKIRCDYSVISKRI